MSLLMKPSHALFFNGITDGVTVPRMNFRSNFGELHEGSDLNNQSPLNSLSSFTLEAWVIPDSGGIVWEQENICRLIVGSPSSPGPAHFQVQLRNANNGAVNTFTLSTAQSVSGPDGEIAYWDGITFPQAGDDVHDTFSAQDKGKNDLTALNLGHRELMLVTATFDRRIISLAINGAVVAQRQLTEDHELVLYPTTLSIGGTGGEYRGVIEAIHWTRGASDAASRFEMPIKSDSTIGLWRFEEPVEPFTTVLDLPSISAQTGVSSSISIGTTLAQALVDSFTGKAGESSVTLTTSPQSTGNYAVTRTNSGGTTSTVSIPHVPYNLLINPLGYDNDTGIPNREAPERMRITAVDASAGTMTVESIHLDFASNASTGRRGALMAHSAGIGVIVTGDCLVDAGQDNPNQKVGTGTQFSHRQGQVLIDESDLQNHGIMFSTTMAITDNDYTKFSATTRMDDKFLIGHTGRHTLNHVNGHPFMGMLPKANAAFVEQSVDAVAQIMEATFTGRYGQLKDVVVAGSEVAFHDEVGDFPVTHTTFTSSPTQVVENGMAGVDDTKRGLLAIGGTDFDAEPFALKGLQDSGPTGAEHTRHLTPSSEPRIAVLKLPSLATHDYAPFVQVHYEAIDFGGTGLQYAATGRLVSGYSSSAITLQSTKAFGKDTGTTTADKVFIGSEVAGASSITVTISHSPAKLTFSSAPTSAFQTAAVTGAVVRTTLDGSALIVNKTIPSASKEVTSGTRVLDIMHTDIAAGTAVLYAPGGVIEFDASSDFYFKDGDLIGDDTEGTLHEGTLDESKAPKNYLPAHSTDSPQSAPSIIPTAFYDDNSRPSYFHKLIVGSSEIEDLGSEVDVNGNFKAKFAHGRRIRTGVFVNNAGGYAASTTNFTVSGVDATTVFAVGVPLYSLHGQKLGEISALSATSITISTGSTAAIVHREELFYQPIRQSRSNTNQGTPINEVFDIVSHRGEGGRVRLVVQPTDRTRFNQLSKMLTLEEDSTTPNKVSIEYVMSRGKVLDFQSSITGQDITLRAHGLVADALSNSVNVKGDGAPDSFVVKEIMPGAPVVTMTMGGPGQGAVNTKPTFSPSAVSRLGWSLRRNCVTKVSALGSTTITVVPLNNSATDLASWGTYCFPQNGRIYFKQSVSTDTGTDNAFASAEYSSKTGTAFTFTSSTGQRGLGTFVDFDGRDLDSFAAWKTAVGISVGNNLHMDDKFDESSVVHDGTTINDRMFQSLNSVQHDYQLGTQYASTRAMVEIPLFHDQFFNALVGPDNSMKLHLDATYTAPSWSPNPVGRRPTSTSPEDPALHSAYSVSVVDKTHREGTTVSAEYDAANRRVYVTNHKVFPAPSSIPVTVANINGGLRLRTAYTANGEWVMYSGVNTANGYLEVAGNAAADDNWAFSAGFKREFQVGMQIMPPLDNENLNYQSVADNPLVSSAGYEGRDSFYFDRANVMTQGGNIDYGLKQYVSAVEFRAGPSINPHLARVKNKRAKGIVSSFSSPTLVLEDGSDFPLDITANSNYAYRVRYYDTTASAFKHAHYNTRTGNSLALVSIDTGFNPPVGTEITLIDVHTTTSIFPEVNTNYFLNTAWANPYCPGGLRAGDTVWMNMHYTNPHATEGLFCKSRGTLNEGEVWEGFLGGEGDLAAAPRSSLPLENFLIGNSCLETARNFVQHVNKTIEMNYESLGWSSAIPVVAYLDPYQSTEEHARVLLYDVAHDREFIAFQDLHMQVQSSPAAVKIGTDNESSGAHDNDKRNSGIDVAAGFNSQNKNLASTTPSEFVEASMSHNSTWNANVAIGSHATGYHEQTPQVSSIMPRTQDATVDTSEANTLHQQMLKDTTEQATFFDTPDGTRVIPAFLSMKGIRSSTLDLSTHEEDRLQHLPHWTNMDFVRRLVIDLGEVGVKEGVTDIEAAAKEVVRLINQAGAKNGRTHARRPADQYLGEGERFDLGKGETSVNTGRIKDPAARHQRADFAATGSTHDPAPFWNKDTAFGSHDRGSHMGYMRAHLGRIVTDEDGKEGYSVVIHSTVPGASGRNFCVWLDASRAQTPYRPEFLIGHGGRFRNYWCQPNEKDGENMHPAPMPINRLGRPFAPITTLREYLPVEQTSDEYQNNLDFGPEIQSSVSLNTESTTEHATGRSANTVVDSNFEPKASGQVIVNGLRVGSQAIGRINFGGLTQAGIPGWAPDCSRWGYGPDGENARFDHIYGDNEHIGTKQHGLVNQSAGSYIPDDEIRPDKIGDGQMYGIRLADHRGKSHTVRFVYRQFGEAFAGDLTHLPETLDDEIVIYFDDRDVGQGGFTVGKHMAGKGDVNGRYTAGTKSSFKGNLWNNYNSPAVGISISAEKDGSNDNLKFTLASPYDNGGSFTHTDILGYLGLPDSGLIQLNDMGSGNNGEVYYYTSRSHEGKAGIGGSNEHFLYGVKNIGSNYQSGKVTRIMSPRINFTCVLTDEVMAAAVNFAINMDDPNTDDVAATTFDCTGLYAPDGRTLGEWGVKPGAVRIKAYSSKDRVVPLKHLFESSLTPDLGIQASVADADLSASQINDSMRIDCGYLPKTLLTITTKFRGPNANTATPVLVNSQNNIVSTDLWRQNLRGDNFYRLPGDRIIPMVNSPMIEIATINTGTPHIETDNSNNELLFLALTPASNDSNSWGNQVVLWLGEENWARVQSTAGSTSHYHATIVSHSDDFLTTAVAGDILVKQNSIAKSRYLQGIRTKGSKHGEPFLYFRGGKPSPDRWVPLYFGGGFSGVTVDINDGTENDYSEFYTHPYADGPTGASGMQNVGEIAGSYALLDANAMMAMFPGTPYLNQHNGRNHMPFFNQDAMLSPDLDAGNNTNASSTGVTYAGGGFTVNCARPSPIVIRFGHPHARYDSTPQATDSTTYLVFGPGQAVPHNFASFEPQLSNIIETGNGYSAVPTNHPVSGLSLLPNIITHGDASIQGFGARLPPAKEYQKTNVQGFNFILNWEPTKGSPNATYYGQSAGEGRYYQSQLGASSPPANAHLMNEVFTNVAGVAMGHASLPTTHASGCVWHMDGGYHPGGHFLDNHIIRNIKHPKSLTRLATGSGTSQNPSVFRVASALAKAYLGTYDSEAAMDHTDNIFIIDATRCQNAEELAAVVATSINTFPGTEPLKAIGGTFLPSMQHAAKQDRYGWVTLDAVQNTGYTEHASGPTAATLTVTSAIPTTLPQYGWLRVSDGAVSGFAPYVSYTGATFTLGVNTITSNSNIVNPVSKAAIHAPSVNGANVKVYVWTKAGTHRYNNSNESINERTQVHFNGLMDAVDRTKPIGAVGWAGERYSYLNSLEVGTTSTFAAGLGAWHPFLGFSPYGSAESCVGSVSPHGSIDTITALSSESCVHGLASRHLIAVTHESELPLIAKTDRDGIIAMGDWLDVKRSATLANAGTVAWSTTKVHNKDRYVSHATAGPHIEAIMVNTTTSFPQKATSYPAVGTEAYWHSRVTAASHISRGDACHSPTGDLFWDKSIVPARVNHEDSATYGVECTGVTTKIQYYSTSEGLYKYYNGRQAARNFLEEHVVWKRMDGGNLTLPASNARGLGMTPWTVRKDGVAGYKTVGEEILGNNRFSFETTNKAMMPLIQAQELSHPQLELNYPLVESALNIPNEELQFQSLQVIDDTGQEHRLEGGSPLGTIIYDFRHVSDRDLEGLAPSLAGDGVSPNMRIRLPLANEIPGNIIVRPGFDRIQGYQTETMGAGGIMHPLQGEGAVKDTFADTYTGPRLWPTWENNGWEHLSQDGSDVSNDRLAFPNSSTQGWQQHTDNASLKTAYEPHDRALHFHVTKMGATMTHRYDVDELTFNAYDPDASPTPEITVGSTPEDATWIDAQEKSSGRWFLRVYDPTTNEGVLASYTGKGTNKFTGVVVSPDFVSFVTGKTGLKVVPSYYMPAGSTRFFAARRLRDHTEYSGASPDMPTIDWPNVGTTPMTQLGTPKLTPMPIPRMGHHYVNATMAMMPGHYAHPAYQRLYDLHRAASAASVNSLEEEEAEPSKRPHRDPLIWFSGVSASISPSDIHGGAFTLLTETKLKFEGYGVAASIDANKTGGHSIVLEAAGTYTQNNHFPDPMEVGAYQIVIQPNLFKQQFNGFHRNGPADNVPDGSVIELTGQQVNTVIAIEHSTSGDGGYTLVLAEATMADVRGCEILLNELMLDIEPDAGSQFANLPPLALYNPLGVEESASPAFSRRSLPYHPNMFVETTPGFTITVPWWAQLHKDGARAAAATYFRHLEWHTPDHYYQLNRATFGAVGAQITLAGYPTCYPDIYAEHFRIRSLNPNTRATAKDASAKTITVTNAELFPVDPYYGEQLEYMDSNGERQLATYTHRVGTLAHATLGSPVQFAGVVNITPNFWTNLTVSGSGTIVKLTGPYANRFADEIYTDSNKSIATRNLLQTYTGTRDTNSLHLPDAFLCMWHPNLGRPFTYYSDDGSRSFYTKAGDVDSPVLKKGLNNIPEHYETVHYNDFFYAASKGPFALGMNWLKPPYEETNSYSLQAVSDSIGTLSNRKGINFQQIHATTTWMTGMRVVGDDIIVSNRGNNNDYDTDNVFFSKIDITNTDGIFDQQSAGLGDSDLNSCDGFDIDPSGTKMIITNFHGGGVRSATLASAFDLTSTFSFTGSTNLGSQTGIRAASWNNDGTKYYIGFASTLRQFTAATAYTVASGDTEGTSATISANVISDILFNSDGTKMWLSGASGYVREYTLSTPFDTSTSSLDVTLDLRTYFLNKSASVSQSGSDTTPWVTGMDWSDDGTKLYVSTLWGVVDDSKMSNNPSPSTVNGVDGASTTNRFPIMEISISTTTSVGGTGATFTASQLDATSALSHQGGTIGSDKFNFAGYWPGGSRGGAGSSRLDGFLEALIGWGGKLFGVDCVGFRDNSGVDERTYAEMTSDSDNARNYCFGYRMAVRQPMNRPRWSPYVRGYLEVANSNALLGYYHGPFVQQDSKTNGWKSGTDYPASYAGILERLTQISALFNEDQLGRQVRYSDGRRMTKPFGCPVRVLRNPSTVRKMYAGDAAGKEIYELANAHRYYLVDWWGNTRGEDVRRFPVRGFGISPAWDPENAYTDGGRDDRPANRGLFASYDDRQSGNANTVNNDATDMGTADWFNPAKSVRVGDRGDGRGVRWPTHFNESLLMDVSESIEPTGLVLSQPTSEPTIGKGLNRPRNDVLQAEEIERGISARLELDSEEGLLKPEAMVSESIETISANTDMADPVGADGVRIGLDVDTMSELNDGESQEYIIMSTEAHSLHSNRSVGQRTTLRGAKDVGSQTLGHLDMTALSWSAQPVKGILKISDAHSMWSLGGTYIMDWSVRQGALSDEGWGKANTASTSNPYQDANHDPTDGKTNVSDSRIEFLVRPVRTLDKHHVQLFRGKRMLKTGSPQDGSNFYLATGGGKYGIYTSDAPSARTGTPSSPPYSPVYSIAPNTSVTASDSNGPKILGVDVTGYDKTDITNPVARIVMSENTLEHFRSDAARKEDFSVEPRYSQSLHPKGADGDTNFNTGDHSTE